MCGYVSVCVLESEPRAFTLSCSPALSCFFKFWNKVLRSHQVSHTCNLAALASQTTLQLAAHFPFLWTPALFFYFLITCFPVHSGKGFRMAGGKSFTRPTLSVSPRYTSSIYCSRLKKQPRIVMFAPETMWSWISPANGCPSYKSKHTRKEKKDRL